MADLPLRKLAEDATTITLGWDPVPGADGYRFSRENGAGKFSHTFDGSRSSVRFSKDSEWYRVEALDVSVQGTYPPPVVPPPPPPPPPTTTDRLLFMPKLGPATDSYLNGADAARKVDINKKLDLPMAYIPNWTSWLPSQQYVDPAAIYNPNHPDHSGAPPVDFSLVLHDAAGKPLFIPWGSKNAASEYPQYAADQSNPKWVQIILDRVAKLLQQGHKGPHLDDVNLPMSLSGTPAGAMATPAAQKDAVCDLVEAVRAKYPNIWISANTRWFDSPNHDGVDPYVERIAKAVDMVSIERGINDAGLTAGTGSWSIDRLFKYVDTIHGYGCNVWWMSYATSAADVEANCAAYWCTWQPGDSLSGGEWWKAWPAVYDIDLGDPKGLYTYSGGVHRREFTKGHVELADNRVGKVTVAA